MEYIIRDSDNNEHRFNYNYSTLKEEYNEIKSYSNEEFLNNLPKILHTTIFICWIKEIPTNVCLNDMGIIHELVHLLNNIESPFQRLDNIRKIWNNLLVL